MISGILREDLVLALHDLELIKYNESTSSFDIVIDKALLEAHLKMMEERCYHIINEDALIWSPMLNVSYGVSPEKRKRKKATSQSGLIREQNVGFNLNVYSHFLPILILERTSPPRMLLSPMKITRNVEKVDTEHPRELEIRDINTYTKYYPNWIPAGDDADKLVEVFSF